MKCTVKVKYDAGRWICTCKGLFKALGHYGNVPDQHLVKAITAFHNRYYPDELDDSKKYPWNAHNKKTNINNLKKYVDPHDLTWHWRLLLPCLSKTLASGDSDNSIVLCVSQIRQWQLVSCFQMIWPNGKTGATLLASIRSADKNLLRPPVFGKSHRITRWEVYASFYDPDVLNEIKEAIKKSNNDPFRLAHILGRHDTYIRIIKPTWNAIKKQYEMEIEQVIDLDPEHEPARIEKWRSKPKHKPDEIKYWHAKDVCRPYGSARLPQFMEVNAKEPPKTKALLFSSDNYCRTFEQVSDVLNGPSAQQVLVIAPPGSGKEDLCEIFHTCRGKNGFLIKTSLAGLDAESAAFQLFNLQLDKLERRIETIRGVYQPRKPFQIELQDGAIFKALGGTLIIDELDKADDKVRSMLLRFLESDDVAIPGTSIVLKIPKEMRPLYVFAGSKTRKEFLQLGPIDFWSRITHIVEMQHPLALGETTDRLRTAEDYVRSFWFKRVEEFFNDEKLLKVPEDRSKVRSKVLSKDLSKPVREKFVICWRFFVSRDVGDFVARELAEAICGQGKPIPSVRTIRGTVSRCFNSIFHSLLYNKKSDASLEIWADEFYKSRCSLPTLKEPLTKLHRLMGDSLKQPTQGKIKIVEANALKEIRMIIRASISIQV